MCIRDRPRTVLTRQTVQGRANDGGLRVGELERDAIVGHGLSYFLQESMLVRGDEYYIYWDEALEIYKDYIIGDDYGN